MAVVILRTHYPSGRTWTNICSSSGDGDKTYYASRLSRVVRRSRRISKDSLSRQIMRLVPVFILETHYQTNYKCLPKFVQTDNAS